MKFCSDLCVLIPSFPSLSNQRKMIPNANFCIYINKQPGLQGSRYWYTAAPDQGPPVAAAHQGANGLLQLSQMLQP